MYVLLGAICQVVTRAAAPAADASDSDDDNRDSVNVKFVSLLRYVTGEPEYPAPSHPEADDESSE